MIDNGRVGRVGQTMTKKQAALLIDNGLVDQTDCIEESKSTDVMFNNEEDRKLAIRFLIERGEWEG